MNPSISSIIRSHPVDPNITFNNSTQITDTTINIDQNTNLDDDDNYHLQSGPSTRAETKRKIKLVILMQQLDFLFYVLVVLCYIVDGKNLIFILRTVSEVQFSQPKQIQPDRPLRFFTLASFAICFCGFLSHVSLFSSSTYTPSGLLVDFIGQTTHHHPAIMGAFLIGLDLCSCLVQLLLVLISFTQSHSIPLSPNGSTTASPPDSSNVTTNHNNSQEQDDKSPLAASDTFLQSKETSTADESIDSSSELLGTRARAMFEEHPDDDFLFDLTIAQVMSFLLSSNPPASQTSVLLRPTTPTTTPRPSRVLGVAHAPESQPAITRDVAAEDLDNHQSSNQVQEHSTEPDEQSLLLASLHSRPRTVSIV